MRRALRNYKFQLKVSTWSKLKHTHMPNILEQNKKQKQTDTSKCEISKQYTPIPTLIPHILCKSLKDFDRICVTARTFTQEGAELVLQDIIRTLIPDLKKIPIRNVFKT